MSTEPLFAIVDGYGFVFRAYHSLPPLTRPDGTPVGAVFGFTNMLLKLKNELKATHLVIVFDSGQKNFRHNIYPLYKANRPEVPEDLKPQFALVRQAATALNIPYIELEGYEADDLIASLANSAAQQGFKVNIISSDKDLMQLVNDHIKMYDPMKNKIIDRNAVLEKFAVYPEQVLDFLSLTGDSSDNIPGIPGIGPKTAAELINKYHNLDNIFAHTSEISQNKRRETLEQNREMAYLSKKLLTLYKELPYTDKLESFKTSSLDHDKLQKFLLEQNFNSLLNKIPKSESVVTAIIEPTIANLNENIINIAQLQKWLDKIKDTHKLAIHLNFQPKTSNISSITLSYKTGNIATIDLSYAEPDLILNTQNSELSWSQIHDFLVPIVSDPATTIIGHDIKQLMYYLPINHYEDIMLMSYCIAAGLHEHDLVNICDHYLPNEQQPLNSNSLMLLLPILKQKMLTDQVFTIYERIEKPLSKVIYHIEKNGVKLDQTKLALLSKEYGQELQLLEDEIYKQAGTVFNISSPKQLSEVLFKKLGFVSSNNKKLSTGADILEELAAQGHAIAQNLLRYRQISKLKNTYTDALPKQIDPQTQRVHTKFSMANTSTGRLTSSEPNLQNIPIRTEEGNKIRSAFIAEKNCQLVFADYSQIELRILAHIADIKSLKLAFQQNKDIHAVTASEIFGVRVSEVTPELRRKAKTINFGIIYGISAFGLSEQLFIPVSHAKEIIDRYFEQYPGIKNYMETTKAFARQHGYVLTIFGRKCHVPAISDPNFARRGFGERAAINAPIQGSNADIIKKAMLEIEASILKDNLAAKMILQVHDELVLEAADEAVEHVEKLVKDKMENIVTLTVPLLVDIGHARSWVKI